jgi:L-2-hydroxyglutarate oxidase LhgO
MECFETESVVIGAGVIGLAIARAMARAGMAPLILEKNAVYGEETSARNSEVIHAGIYYDAGSAKARHCVTGKQRLYDYCALNGIAHRRCGKLIVATDAAEVDRLDGIATRAAANGVDDLETLTAAQAQALEPALRVTGALLSPSTGIVDSHALMLAYLGEAEAHGAQLVTHASVDGGALRDDGRIDLITGGQTSMRLTARHVVNAAGLWAQDVAACIEGVPAPPPRALVKGNYFALTSRAPFDRLIYPVPADGGLGVHLTLDMAGRAKFGPDTEWLDSDDPAAIDYTVDPARGDGFYASIRRYWPALPDNALAADYAGVRPKVRGDDYPDFYIEGPDAHGLPGHVMLYGMESPGLTSSLSIADDVVAKLRA